MAKDVCYAIMRREGGSPFGKRGVYLYESEKALKNALGLHLEYLLQNGYEIVEIELPPAYRKKNKETDNE